MIDTIPYSDNELLKMVKEGNEEAFRQLFFKFYPRLLRYAVRYVNDEDIAEDIRKHPIKYTIKKGCISFQVKQPSMVVSPSFFIPFFPFVWQHL